MGGGYIALEFGQAAKRLGSHVTIIQRGSQLASREDADVGEALLQLCQDEGIKVLLGAELRKVTGTCGESIRAHIDQHGQERVIDATDLLVAAGRTRNTACIGLHEAGVQLDDKGYNPRE